MKRKKVLSVLMTAVLAVSSVMPQNALLAYAEGDEGNTEAVAEELPYGLAGMPGDYRPDTDQIEMKQEMKAHNVLKQLENAVEGVDYEKGKVIALADSEEEALQIASAYNATLSYYAQGVAEIELPEELSVSDAMDAAMKYDSLPVVEANYLTPLEEPVHEAVMPDMQITASAKDSAGDSGWSRWVMGSYDEDPLFGNPDTYLKDPGSMYYQWMHDAIGTWDAWKSTMGSPEIRVAVIDSGVQPDHPDLEGRVEQIKVGEIEPDNYVDPHGTHVAGIIGAMADNGQGVAGVAPYVSIVSLNVFTWYEELNRGACENADEARALQLCIDEKIPVANMSLGSPGYSVIVAEKAKEASEAGVSIFAAMGNDYANGRAFPAACKDTIAVASVNIRGEKSDFSNYGDWCDIAAPGTDIMSTYNDLLDNSGEGDSIDTNAYGLMSGTSMACPVAAGAAALYMSKVGVVSPQEIRKVMQSTASKSSSKGIGAGILNVGAMFASVELTPVIKLSEDGSTLLIGTSSVDDSAQIIYTTDGRRPTVKNGEVVYGNPCYGEVDLRDFPSGTKVTVNALAISSQGIVSKTVEKTVTAPDLEPGTAVIESVSFDHDKDNIGFSFNEFVSEEKRYAVFTPTIIADGAKAALDTVSYRLSSSNPSVAGAFDNYDGTITVCGFAEGNAKITLEVSGSTGSKSASIAINVNRLADDIEISGPDALVAGGSGSYKGKVLPLKVKDNKISWSIQENDKVSVDQKGKVSVAADATGSFILVAKTESGASSFRTIDIVSAKVGSVTISSKDSRFSDKNATIFTADVPQLEGVDNEIRLFASAPYVSWKSSNEKVAVIDRTEDGAAVIRGLKAGTAKISCTTTDGSKKKATVAVKVIVPASDLILSTDENCGYYYGGRIGIGKSKQIKYKLGSTYGKPSVTALEYDYILYDYYENKDLTEKAKANKVIKIDKKGKVTVDKKRFNGLFNDDYFHDAELYVIAKTTDGTELTSMVMYLVQPATSFFVPRDFDEEGNMFTVTNVEIQGEWINDMDGNSVKAYTIFIETDAYLGGLEDVEVKCSNTDLISVFPGGLAKKADGTTYQDEKSGHFFYMISLYATDPEKRKGTATITLTANDGSKKKASFKVTIK